MSALIEVLLSALQVELEQIAADVELEQIAADVAGRCVALP